MLVHPQRTLPLELHDKLVLRKHFPTSVAKLGKRIQLVQRKAAVEIVCIDGKQSANVRKVERQRGRVLEPEDFVECLLGRSEQRNTDTRILIRDNSPRMARWGNAAAYQVIARAILLGALKLDLNELFHLRSNRSGGDFEGRAMRIGSHCTFFSSLTRYTPEQSARWRRFPWMLTIGLLPL